LFDRLKVAIEGVVIELIPSQTGAVFDSPAASISGDAATHDSLIGYEQGQIIW